MDQLQRFLNLQPADNRCNRWSSGYLALLNVFLLKQRTAIPQRDQAIIVLGHRALVTGALGRHEDFRDSVDLLDTTVDPGRVGFPAHPIDP